MKCKHCGKEIANDSVFCEYCGKQVKSTPAKRNKILLIVGGVVILILGFVLGHFLLRSGAGDMGETINVVDHAISQSNKNLTLALNDRYSQLYAVMGEDQTEAIKAAQEKAKELQRTTKEMVTFIEQVRWDMTVAVDGENAAGVKRAKAETQNGAVPCVPVSEIENLSKNSDFISKNCADALKKKLTDYHVKLLKFIENEEGKRDPQLEKQLSMVTPASISSKGKEVEWEKYYFQKY